MWWMIEEILHRGFNLLFPLKTMDIGPQIFKENHEKDQGKNEASLASIHGSEN